MPFMTINYVFLLTTIFRLTSSQYGVTFREPRLECSTEGIRLLFEPLGQFTGHVYVKGFFFSKSCHLNYSGRTVDKPFSMDIPYRGDCNVRRHHSSSPASVSYDTTVVVQHHPLFVTAGDRAYRVNCVYRQIDTAVSQHINIHELSTQPVASSSRPSCHYDVLSPSLPDNPPLKYANVGDPVLHRWSCHSDVHGFLVHSCIVRNDVGEEYKLVDERGCVIDSSLVPDLAYSSDLSVAKTTIRAFRFADQVMVHFACQITLCRKADEGCEGISPPTCHPIEFPPIHTEYRSSTQPNSRPTLPPRDGASNTQATQITNQVTPDQFETSTEDWQKVIAESIAEFESGFSELPEEPTESTETTVSEKTITSTTTAGTTRTTLPTTYRTVLPEVYKVDNRRPFELYTVPSTKVQITTTTPAAPPSAYVPSDPDPPAAPTPSESASSGSSKWLNGQESAVPSPEEEYGLEIVDVSKQDDGSWLHKPSASPPASWDDHGATVADRAYRTQLLSSTFVIPVEEDNEERDDGEGGEEKLPYPAAADVYYASRRPRSQPRDNENITMEVEAKEFIVFAAESPVEMGAKAADAQPVTSQQMILSQTVWMSAGIALQITLICVIVAQRHFYNKTMERLKTQMDLY